MNWKSPWRKHQRLPLLLVIVGIVLLQASYAISTSGRLAVSYNSHVVVVDRSGRPLIFSAAVIASLVLGLGAFCVAAFLFLRSPSTDTSAERDNFRRSHGWGPINVLGILASLWVGYSRMAPENLAHSNPDQLFCFVILVTAPVFVLGTLWLGAKRCRYFLRPSLGRFPLNFWYDPLQFLFIGTFALLAAAIGSSLRLPNSGTVGYWSIMSQWCMFIGWVVGQVIGYAIYRKRIKAAHEQLC